MTRIATLVLIVLAALASPVSAQRHPYPLTEAERSAIDRGLRTGDIAGYKTRNGRDYRLGEFNARDLAVIYRGEDRIWNAIEDLDRRKADANHGHTPPPAVPTPTPAPAPPGAVYVPPSGGAVWVPPGTAYIYPPGTSPGAVVATPLPGATAAPIPSPAPTPQPPAQPVIQKTEGISPGLLAALGLLAILLLAGWGLNRRDIGCNRDEIRQVRNEHGALADEVRHPSDGLEALRNQVRHATDGLPAIAGLRTDLAGLRGDHDTLAGEIRDPGGVSTRLTDLSDFVRGTAGTPGLVNRLDSLDAEIQAARASEPDLATRINGLDVTTLRADVDRLRADVDEAAEDLGVLTDWSAGMDGLVDANQRDAETVLGDVLSQLDRKDRQLVAVGTAAGVDVDAIT